MGKQGLLGLRLSDELWTMLDGLVAQQNEEMAGMGISARVGPQDVLRQLIHNAHVAGGVKALAGMIALTKKVAILPKRPPPAPGPIDNEVEYNLEASKGSVEPPAPPKKASRKAEPSPPVPQALPQAAPPTPVPAPLTTTSDDALAEIGLPPEAAPNPPTEDDEIAAMLDSV